jgi:hypothetical protein
MYAIRSPKSSLSSSAIVGILLKKIMSFESKPLDQITADDIRALISVRRRESPTLEYKEAYKRDDRGSREFLLDVCMFGNSGGGDILIGISEIRDADGHATGYPDPDAPLGIELPNPEQQLLAYESQILEAIDERLPVKLRAVPCDNLYVLVVRVPNSLAKPHRVHYNGKIYFPARRERRRYELNAREIKELVLRTAAQSDKAEAIIDVALNRTLSEKSPLLIVALLPIFSSNFSVDLRNPQIQTRFAHLSVRGDREEYVPTLQYTLEGLAKRYFRDMELTLGHNGLLKLKTTIPSSFDEINGMDIFFPVAIDIFVRGLVTGAGKLFEAAGLGPPALLGVALALKRDFYPKYSDWDDPIKLPARDHRFPTIALTALGLGAEIQIRPLCDHIHQAFERAGSPSFDSDGNWIKQK